jgi:SAM-dependent methyltransferase
MPCFISKYMDSLERKLKQFLNLYWLRPENGLLTTFKSLAIDDHKFKKNSLDISCGDGLFLFLHLGGEISDDFDYFLSTKASSFDHSNFVDIYDSFDDKYSVPIIKKPLTTVNYGLDWKQNLLDKSSKLDLYENLLLHDTNQTPLLLPENSFETIYSNSIYWINRPENLLDDIHRLLRPGGRAILEVMTPSHMETLNKITPLFSSNALSILDRKRRETTQGLRNYHTWRKIFTNKKYKIIEEKSVYPHHAIIDFWNIGLRPISHLLIQMSDNLSKNERSKIKEEWVGIFFELFKQFLYINPTYTLENSPYISFVLEK